MRLLWSTIAIVTALLALRNAGVVLSPRFLAEEGDLLFANAWLLPGAEALWNNTMLRGGYLNVFPVFSTWLAAKAVPLEWAPALVLVQIGTVQACALALALAGPRRELDSVPARFVTALIVAYFPYNYAALETWLSAMHSAVHFGVIALLLLLADEARESRAWRWTSRSLLALGAVSGPYVIVLAPAFVLKWWFERSRETRVRAMLVCAIGALQVAIALIGIHAGDTAQTRSFAAVTPETVYVALVFQLLCAVTGAIPGQMLLQGLGAIPGPGFAWADVAVGLAVAAAILALAWRVAPRSTSRTLVVLALASWFVFTTTFAVKGFPANRYVVCTSTAFGLLFALAAFSSRGPRGLRAVFGVLLACGIATSFIESLLLKGPLTGLDRAAWQDEVRLWRADPDHELRLWPSVWTTHLADPARRDALVAALAAAPARVALTPGRGTTLPLAEAGLPAYFAIRFENCASDDGVLRIVGKSRGGGEEFVERMPFTAGCRERHLNSMMLAFAGFHAFSRVVALDFSVEGPPGPEVQLSRFAMDTPVTTVIHPFSGQ